MLDMSLDPPSLRDKISNLQPSVVRPVVIGLRYCRTTPVVHQTEHQIEQKMSITITINLKASKIWKSVKKGEIRFQFVSYGQLEGLVRTELISSKRTEP